MTRRIDKPSQYIQHNIRSNSRQSRDRDPPSNPRMPINSYKDFASYSNQIQNSSGHSDLPSKTPNSGKRSSKITSLQQEFEDLKRKIRQVQNKNQKIIEKISNGKEIRMRKSQEVSQNESGYQIDNQSNGGKYGTQTFPDKKNQWPPVPHPHRRTPFFEADAEPKSLVQIRPKQSFQIKKGNDSMNLGHYRQNSREKNRMKVDILALEDKYNKQQSKLDYVKNNFKNYSDCVKLIFENQLGQFMENIQKAMQMIEGKNNKNRERLNRLDGRLTVSRGSKRKQTKMSSSFDLGSKRREKSETSNSEVNKAKTKQFEALINKYQQLLRSKNEQIQKLTNLIKIKEREAHQINDRFDQIKEQKRKMGHQHDDLVARLQNKIQSLMQKPPGEHKKKQFINLAMTKDKQRQREKSRQKEREKQKEESLSDKYLKQIKILESKLSFTESRLEQKLKAIQSLQIQINNINTNKLNLINQYQQTLERTRQSHKIKYQQLLSSIASLKSHLKSKQQFILKQTDIEKQLQHRCIQLQIELNTLGQKLILKQDIERMQRSAVKRAYEIQQNIPIQNISFTSENNFNKIQSLEQEKRQLQFLYDKLRNQFEMYRLSSKSNAGVEQIIRQKQSVIKDLKTKLQRSESNINNIESPLFKRRQTNLLDSKINDQKQIQDMRHKMRIQDQDIIRLKNINDKIKQQNIMINSKVIGLQHDISLNNSVHQQQQQKIKQMKYYIDELERTVSQLQKIIAVKDKQLSKNKQSHEKQFTTIENQLKVMQDQFAIINSELIKETDKVNIKVLEVKKLQQQNQDLKLQLYQVMQEKQRFQIQLQDIQEDNKKQGLIDSRVNQEYKDNVLKLKQEIEALRIDNVSLVEINKHQKMKIEELELQVFMDNQNQQQCMSEVSDIKTETLATKVRTLQNLNLENDINKANLQRHLKNAEENNTKLMQQVHQLITDLDKNKSEFSSTVIAYEERIHQFQEMLLAAENALKQKEREKEEYSHNHGNLMTVPNDKVFKSDIRSQSSLMFSNTSQLFGDKEIDFKLSDDGGSEVGEINVEAIFNNINYPYENIKLRRKDQVEFIKNTALLINRLKSTINEKNRKIKGLEKKVMPERHSSDFGRKMTESFKSEDFDDIDDFNENYSVRFDDKKHDKQRKIKQLENETHLVMEQNNLLLQQVTNLQDQLQKSEDQENNLIRLKEILKQEVKKLQKALDLKQVQHQQEVKKTQRLIQENESVHNSETMRILLPKVFNIACNEQYMRKEEKRRELEEYIKIVCTILKIEFVPVRYSGRR